MRSRGKVEVTIDESRRGGHVAQPAVQQQGPRHSARNTRGATLYTTAPRLSSSLQRETMCCSVLPCGTVCCSVVQNHSIDFDCATMCCSEVQCVAVQCRIIVSTLHVRRCVAVLDARINTHTKHHNTPSLHSYVRTRYPNHVIFVKRFNAPSRNRGGNARVAAVLYNSEDTSRCITTLNTHHSKETDHNNRPFSPCTHEFGNSQEIIGIRQSQKSHYLLPRCRSFVFFGLVSLVWGGFG